MGNGSNVSSGIRCDADYVFPVVDIDHLGDYHEIIVHYSEELSAEEIHCIRYEFFMMFPVLKMNLVQPSDANKESWFSDMPIDPGSKGKNGNTIGG